MSYVRMIEYRSKKFFVKPHNWRASETLLGVYKFKLVLYMCIVYMYGGTCT